MKALRMLVLSGIFLMSGVFMQVSAQAEIDTDQAPRKESGEVVTKEPVVFLKDKAKIQATQKAKSRRKTFKLRRRIRPCSFGTVYY